MRKNLIFILLFSIIIFVRCSDSKDDFSEFDSPEDFDSQPVQPPEEKKPEVVTNPPKDEVGILLNLIIFIFLGYFRRR
jgi:hypothetical protein